ncbi:hypothetical protein NMY22_g11286 [Coprinellus aureogranulatus]|nr:hypothetical protein NMY22_g11286 [Coprinellus aureogranulatus]
MLVSMQSNARLMVGRGALPMTSFTATHHLGSSSHPSPPALPSQTQRRFVSDGQLKHHQQSTDSAQRASKASNAAQSQSPLAPIGVQAALEYAAESKASKNKNAGSSLPLLSADEENAKPTLSPSSNSKDREPGSPKPKIFEEFALRDRVGIVSGGNRGLGLEMAVALCEAGARAIYCLDLPSTPSAEFEAAKGYLAAMDDTREGQRRLEYVQVDVTDQEGVWERVKEIGDREGRMEVCVAAAGILKAHTDCLRYPAGQFKEVIDVNVNGVLYTAQAAGQQMERFGNRGSIILIASMSGSITNRDHAWVSYNTSKSAVLQMARSMACELGKKNIRVNSLSPGHIYTSMTNVGVCVLKDDCSLLGQTAAFVREVVELEPDG